MSPRLSRNDERKLEAIYAEIPGIPGCSGKCAAACGPIAMFKGEWERVKRAKGGSVPKLKGLTCPMLSANGWCTVYSVRPYICRLWGTTRELQCPYRCEPDRWLSLEESMDIYMRIREIAGPETAGPLGSVNDLWEAIALEPRRDRRELIEKIKEVRRMKEAAHADSQA